MKKKLCEVKKKWVNENDTHVKRTKKNSENFLRETFDRHQYTNPRPIYVSK